MSANNTYDVIIIGAGPAGLTAGLYCKRAALNAVLVEKGLIGGQIAISKDVENYPGMEGITGFDLAEKLHHHTQSYNLPVIQQAVAEITPGSDLHLVRLENGDTLKAAALILAVGGSVKKLGIPGEADYLGTGVSYCATCDGFFFRNKSVVVIGGGDTAVEEALYLSKIAESVRLIHRGSSLRASRILQERLFNEPRIKVIWDTIAAAIKGDASGVTAVSIENVKTGAKEDLQTDGVFIFVGYLPNNELIPASVQMDERGFVITDDKCATTVPGIFAAGDLRKKFANQIVVAAADGCIAALASAHYVELHKTRAENNG
ncbi:MAG TPA: thioredoxin-disulfide reductase [Dissulfurispiraceae bacterium]|nr:thioredoxin-disulfide reductase [Dissulfurispiraceae bacterium]